MKNWILIVICALQAVPMAIASDQRTPAAAPSDTKAVEQAHPDGSTSGADAASTELCDRNPAARSAASQHLGELFIYGQRWEQGRREDSGGLEDLARACL